MSLIHFPHGHLPGPIPLLVVLPQPESIALFAPYFPIPGAMFVGAGAALTGIAIKAAVVMGIPASDMRAQNYVRDVVQQRFLPGALPVLWL